MVYLNLELVSKLIRSNFQNDDATQITQGILLSTFSVALVLASGSFFQFRSINEDAVVLDLEPNSFHQNYEFMGALMLAFCLLSFLAAHGQIRQL